MDSKQETHFKKVSSVVMLVILVISIDRDLVFKYFKVINLIYFNSKFYANSILGYIKYESNCNNNSKSSTKMADFKL